MFCSNEEKKSSDLISASRLISAPTSLLTTASLTPIGMLGVAMATAFVFPITIGNCELQGATTPPPKQPPKRARGEKQQEST
jgi:hypothetical protein